MIYATSTREKLVDLLQRGSAKPFDSGRPVSEDMILRLEGKEEIGLLFVDTESHSDNIPSVLVVEDESSRRDFFAWSATYVDSLRPLTAFIRVMTLSEANAFLGRRVTWDLWGFQRLFVGLMIGEAVSLSDGIVEPEDIPPSAAARGLAAPFARSLAIDGSAINPEEFHALWIKARRLTSSVLPSDTSEHIKPMSAAVSVIAQMKGWSQGYSSPPLIVDACLELVRYGSIGDHTWQGLTSQVPALRNSLNEMLGTREDRIRVFQNALKVLDSGDGGGSTTIRTFVAAALASAISPGRLDYLRLVLESSKALKSLPSWYGLLAALPADSVVMRFAGGLGRRMLREYLRPEKITDSPRCDIALDEYAVLAANPRIRTQVRSGTSGVLVLEVRPFVTTAVRWHSKNQDQQGQSQLPLTFRGGDPILTDILKQLESAQQKLRTLMFDGDNEHTTGKARTRRIPRKK